ncbi:cation transporting ATPase C-terminal domain-containing protein [Rhodoferax sp.]|uniref:cation transporting ATPase C-terminal domain-containing protein n=1 Tax=Rhodoferax sp. TaxID=50421 RepID=UPI0025F3E177|nr:cation transporting ATPase C-terminal domain-containing protein [Rhodoferax sp.]MBU4082289.1 hypothetical protein [Gammaproteobacteria bacterium]MBU4112798.1 hypothetical protein [Gammaproteobacteria bacterium]
MTAAKLRRPGSQASLRENRAVMALAADGMAPASRADVMQRPPRNVSTRLFGGMTLGLALLQGLGALALVLIFSNRSRAGPLWASLRVPNRSLWWVVVAVLSLLLLALYVPWLARLFVFEVLPLPYLGAVADLGLAGVGWFELEKAVKSTWARPDADG